MWVIIGRYINRYHNEFLEELVLGSGIAKSLKLRAKFLTSYLLSLRSEFKVDFVFPFRGTNWWRASSINLNDSPVHKVEKGYLLVIRLYASPSVLLDSCQLLVHRYCLISAFLWLEYVWYIAVLFATIYRMSYQYIIGMTSGFDVNGKILKWCQ